MKWEQHRKTDPVRSTFWLMVLGAFIWSFGIVIFGMLGA
jgi:hypothetical protein